MNAPGAFGLPAAASAVALSARGDEHYHTSLMKPQALLSNAALCKQWDGLAAEASEPNPFGERWYLAAALQALDSNAVRIAAISDRQGLVGLIPLIDQNSYAGLPLAHVQNWLNYNAFLGAPLVRRGAEADFWAMLLTHLDSDGGSALFLHLTGIATNGPLADALDNICRSGKRRFALVQCEERALLERGLSPDAYLQANVRGKKRKELRRQHKRLAEEGRLAFTRQWDDTNLDCWIDEFIALEQRGWKGIEGSALGCAPETQALFRAALAGAAQAGKLERLDLRLDEKPIAMLANFLTPPGAYSFKTAFDEGYARFSPGVLLQVENLALLERDDIKWCDSCAAADHPMIDSLWSGRRPIGRYSIAIGGPAKRAAFAALLAAEKAKARMRGRVIV